MSPEIPLQHDMFTGEKVDNRTRTQKRQDREHRLPRQMAMFSLKVTAQIGVNARPWLKDLPRPQLVLEREEVRSDDEKERDLMREAEALTAHLFVGLPGTGDRTETVAAPEKTPPVPAGNDQEQPAGTSEQARPTPSQAYLKLVEIVKEQVTTIWIDETYRHRFYNQLPLAILDAQEAGLTASEITAALQVGGILGKQLNTSVSVHPQKVTATQERAVSTPRRPSPSPVAGYRARARRANMRTRIRVR